MKLKPTPILTGATIVSEIKSCAMLSMPLAIAQITDSITGFVDTMMMGWLGSGAIAAGALGAISFNYLLWITTSVLSAVSPLAAQAHGAEDLHTVKRVFHQALLLTALLGIPLTALLWFGGQILQYLGQDPNTLIFTEDYLRAIAWGFIPAIGFSMLKGFVSALSRPRSVMIIVVLGIVLNVSGNYVLMFGKFGLPALGLAGIGWSSTIAFWVMFLAMLFYIASSKHFAIYALWSKLHVNYRVLRELLHIGLPIGGLMIVEAGISVAVTFLAGQLGTTSLAAHQIAYQTAGIMTYQIASGISIATTVRVGQFIGKNDARLSRLAGYVGIGLSGVCMGLFSLAFVLIPNQIVGLYIDASQPQNVDVVSLARTLLIVAALFQMIDGVQVTAAGALRGLKDTQIPMGIGVVAHWCIGLPVSYILGMQLDFGVVGLWLGVATGLITAAIVLTWRFRVVSFRTIHHGRNYALVNR
ncbi:MAG: MATE family efflux transporter [Cyanobacteria bacterium P01_A01_bin.37]